MLESGGVVGWCLKGLVFGRREHAEGAVPAAGVVKELDVVVERSRELDPCLPAFAVSSSTCMRPQKDSTIALS